jgi:acetate kinase
LDLAGLIVCLNCGSSSVKAASLESAPNGAQHRLRSANLAGGGPGVISAGGGPGVIAAALDAVAPAGGRAPVAIAHRLVHGGPHYTRATRVDAQVATDLRRLVPLAPLHLPAALAGIEAAARRWPGSPQVACFDTAFHASMPEVARRLPLPAAVLGDEVYRYGFHGLSYAHVMWTLGAAAPPRIVIAHLGSGASLVAVADGRSVDTTMGFTPTGGIPMGTRPGDLDPGVLFYLARDRGFSLDRLERLCEHESGLRGVGDSADARELAARAPQDPAAALALDLFAYQIRKTVGAFAAVLGGLDLLVFTGGIGEHAAGVRAAVCQGLAVLGVELDAGRNADGADPISAAASRCVVRVIPADEEAEMAREARALL